MSKHTPGPWIQAGPSYGGAKMFYTSDIHTEEPDEDDVYQCICHMPRWSQEYDEENEANAAIIAAAPDLLEALEQLLIDMQIAQGNMDAAAKNDKKWEGCAEEIEPRCISARAAIAKAKGETP